MTDYAGSRRFNDRERKRQRVKQEKHIAWTLLLCLMLALAAVLVKAKLDERDMRLEEQRQEVKAMTLKLEQLEHEKGILEEALQRRIRQEKDLLDELEQLEQKLEQLRTIPAVTVTGYAPLDPSSIPGFDYSGDPAVTASGTRSRPGVIAADWKRLPPGTQLEIPGWGAGVVEDSGGAMRRAEGIHIDLYFNTREEALAWGRQQVDVKIKL